MHDPRLGGRRRVQVAERLERLLHHLQPLPPAQRRRHRREAEPLQRRPMLARGRMQPRLERSAHAKREDEAWRRALEAAAEQRQQVRVRAALQQRHLALQVGEVLALVGGEALRAGARAGREGRRARGSRVSSAAAPCGRQRGVDVVLLDCDLDARDRRQVRGAVDGREAALAHLGRLVKVRRRGSQLRERHGDGGRRAL
mmetsp:Transcript_14883/g.47869  ORF Transcript_14883/g.47869 Transcript_14883/m.47869 type:complete len:200 (-) Transcript_14883:285-884(-)